MGLKHFALLFSLTPVLAAAGPDTQMPVGWTRIGLLPSMQPLNLNLPGSYSHWIAGVKVVPGADGSVRVGDGYFPFARWFENGEHFGHPGGAISARVVAHGSTLAGVTSDGVQIAPPTSFENEPVLIVYAGIPAPSAVVISVDGSPKFTANIERSAVIADGVLQESQFMSAGDLVVQASTIGIPQPVSASRPGGFLNPKDAAALLVRVSGLPKAPAMAAPLTFMAKVVVASDGSVQSTTCNPDRVADDLCRLVASSISGWRSRPWLVEGVASPFWTWAPVAVVPDGTVCSALTAPRAR